MSDAIQKGGCLCGEVSYKFNKPDAAFLFAWNHKKEIFKKESQFIKKGKWFAHVKI